MNVKNFVRLTVFNSKSGLSIFDYHKYDEDLMFDEDLFAGVIHAISIILQESVNCGYLRNIDLKEGSLVVKQNPQHNMTFVVVGKEPKFLLKKKLENFEKIFFKKIYFAQMNQDYSLMNEVIRRQLDCIAQSTF